MLIRIFALILLSSASSAQAAVGFGLGLENRYRSSVSGLNSEQKSSPQLSLAWTRGQAQLVVEFAQWNQQSNEGALNIETDTYELMPWARYSPCGIYPVCGLIGLGLGLQRSEVITRVGAYENDTKGDLEWQAGLLIGGQLHFKSWPQVFTELSLRGLRRLEFEESAWSWNFKMGMEFD